MRKLINHWPVLNLVVALAVITLLIAQRVNLAFTQRLLLFLFAFANLHIEEEYAHPGDMPGLLNATLYHNRQSPTRYPFNQLSALCCNDVFVVVIWLVPVFIRWRWLTLAAVLWGMIEFLLHLLYYPHLMKTTYSSGLVTALLGFVPCGVIYLAFAWGNGQLSVIDILSGLIYSIVWYLLIFRWLGARILATRQPRYPFTTHQMIQYVKVVKGHARSRMK